MAPTPSDKKKKRQTVAQNLRKSNENKENVIPCTPSVSNPKSPFFTLRESRLFNVTNTPKRGISESPVDTTPRTPHNVYSYKKREFTGPSCEKLSSYASKTAKDHTKNVSDHYQVIHNSLLIELMKQTVCERCQSKWNGDLATANREGLYCSLVFTCKCGHMIKIGTSKCCPQTKMRDVNIRCVIANLAGIGHQGLAKLFGILNVPPSIDDDHYSHTVAHVLPSLRAHQQNSMSAAVEKACTESGSRQLSVSGDGSWQRRGFSSLNGVAAIMSSSTTAKVLDIERMSKKCSTCIGALSIKHVSREKYEAIINKHNCEMNHTGSSGAMEVDGIYRLFERSQHLYNVQYVNYIGDGDAKILPKLLNNPPYDNITINKIEDINHFSKKMLHRLQKIAQDLKQTKIDGKNDMMTNFKYYYRQAVVRNKTNLDEMVKSVWAIWKHKASTDLEPHHEWCSPIFCGFTKAWEEDKEYDHTKHSLPLAVMNAIRPVFTELASRATLNRVLNGSSENANESFHSILWSFAPKNRYSPGTIIDVCVALAVLVYNDGYQSIIPVVEQLTGGEGGYYTRLGMERFDKLRVYYEHKKKRKEDVRAKMSVEERKQQQDDDEQLDDAYLPRAY
ncbi:unnamed protein product [Didymodactylos carnosus]|uniref:Mutator-like transposase domain-containing protein n=1 Tax=Didymodactylos carnosus TaxID=1234261 RepID=A0A815GZE6_9BILA|nr:unnamed protein product [Didymodactylos carnosus]CAF4210408.1 unnamed protein product [Didymodactylos carnosus]